MESINMTNARQITRVCFPFPQAGDGSLIVGFGGGFYAPIHKALAVKDVAPPFLSGRPLI